MIFLFNRFNACIPLFATLTLYWSDKISSAVFSDLCYNRPHNTGVQVYHYAKQADAICP